MTRLLGLVWALGACSTPSREGCTREEGRTECDVSAMAPGTIRSERSYSPEESPRYASPVGDLDADGVEDLKWVNFYGATAGTLSTEYGTDRTRDEATVSQATFESGWEGYELLGIDGVDWNRDGLQDVVLTGLYEGRTPKAAWIFLSPAPAELVRTRADATIGAELRDGGTRSVFGCDATADFDGDGLHDLLCEAGTSFGTDTSDWAVALIDGEDWASEELMLADARVTWVPGAGADWPVLSSGPLGDLDGDGLEDLALHVVSECWDIVMAPTDAVGVVDAWALPDRIVHTDLCDGPAVDALRGDLTGDGVLDFAAYAFWAEDAGGRNTGAAWLYSGYPRGVLDETDAAWTVLGGPEPEGMGADVRNAGDQNHDGFPDLLVSAASGCGDWCGHADTEASVYLYFGPLSGAATNEDADVRIGGLGMFMWDASVGDLDDDATPDLVLEQPEDQAILSLPGGW